MLLKVNEAAIELNTSDKFIYQAIKEGRLRCHHLGRGQGGIRISREQLTAFLKETESDPSLPASADPLKLKHLSL
jgi:excisionase family DNA binding protein